MIWERRIAVKACLLLACLLWVGATLPLQAQSRKDQPPPPSLPSDMLGSWGREESDCTDIQSDGRLHVTLKQIEFADNKLTISRIASQKENWWRIDGANREAGKRGTRPARLELRLDGKDRLFIRNGPGKPEDFIRCKPAQLQG